MARVLLVEDDEINRQLMEYLLRSHGHDVVIAHDGMEGLAALRRERPDIVLCDVGMPRMDGLAFARAVRADAGCEGLPVLAVSSYAMRDDRDRALAAGFDDHVSKPIDPAGFMALLDAHLRGAGNGPRPAAAVPAAEPAPSAAKPPRSRGALVLVVDDEPLNLELKRSCLEPLGYRVVTATSSAEALQLARAETPALIISDVGMPVQDGFEFIVRAKQDSALAGVPFIFVSMTHWDDAMRGKAMALGAVSYLRRPLPTEQLVAEVRRWVVP